MSDDEDPFEAFVEPEDREGDPFERLGGVDPAFEEEFIDEGSPFNEDGSAFESVDIEGVDADEIWESLEAEPTQPAVGESRYVEVSKHRFCEQCEFFTSPPNADCTHEEAEIIEYLDMETVRLLDCPVVAEQRQLENEE